MKFKKLAVLLAAVACVASLALVGCGGSSDEAASGDIQLLNEGQLTVATMPDYPPFENLVDGEYVGLEMDLMQAICDEMGLEFNPITIDFDGIIPAIAAGGQADCAISAISVLPDREEQVDFTTSYYTDDLAIVVMSDSGITEDNLEDSLANATIVAQSGTTGEAYAKENYATATVKGLPNANDTFAAMQAGQADAVITNKTVADDMITSYTDATIVKSIATDEPYAIAVSKDNPALTAALNAAIEKLQADGKIDQIVTQWMGGAAE